MDKILQALNELCLAKQPCQVRLYVEINAEGRPHVDAEVTRVFPDDDRTQLAAVVGADSVTDALIELVRTWQT